MSKNMLLILYLLITFSSLTYAKEINYKNCQSIHDVIARETQEIQDTGSTDHDELAQLFVSRGESYLLDARYEKAIEDFQSASDHLRYSSNDETAMTVAFRIAFGETVSYDNLGMTERTDEALRKLQLIANHVGCTDCIEGDPCQESFSKSSGVMHFRDLIRPAINSRHFSELAMTCKKKKDPPAANNPQPNNQDGYDDILGPNDPPSLKWCEEVVTGVGRAMDAIACLAPNYGVRIALIGVIEALISRGVKCCQAGGFWKACVAPITRKWREWKNNKEDHIYPNDSNLYLYLAFAGRKWEVVS